MKRPAPSHWSCDLSHLQSQPSWRPCGSCGRLRVSAGVQGPVGAHFSVHRTGSFHRPAFASLTAPPLPRGTQIDTPEIGKPSANWRSGETISRRLAPVRRCAPSDRGTVWQQITELVSEIYRKLNESQSFREIFSTLHGANLFRRDAEAWTAARIRGRGPERRRGRTLRRGCRPSAPAAELPVGRTMTPGPKRTR
jgi:hypothetical protein